MVGQRGEPLDRLRPGDGDADLDGLVGQVPELGGVDAIVDAVEREALAVEQRADDLHRLLEHVVPLADGGPALARHVLVEVLPGAEPEGEAVVGQERHGRGLLRHDRGVVAQEGAGHVRHEADALGRLGDRPEHGPRVRGVALGVEPGEVVVAHHLEVEADALRVDRVLHERTRAGLLGHEGVAEAGHVSIVGRAGRTRTRVRPALGREGTVRRAPSP
ncbi:Uncharacterised protein [Mycobacteroides abscessus]|nr:Uncharacterised protein [Mycobacteroides abscessus]